MRFLNKWIFFAMNVAVALIITVTSGASLFSAINGFFYVAFFYFMLMLIAIVIRGRVFDIIFDSFRRYFFNKNPMKKYMDDGLEDSPPPSQRISRLFLIGVRFQAVMLIAIMLVLLAAYYLL